MFKINIIHIGTLKDEYFRMAADEYVKRIGRFAEITLVPLPETKLPPEPGVSQISAALREEGTAILRRLARNPAGMLSIAMCVEGEQPDSFGFASMLSAAIDRGCPGSNFIIGGSCGLSTLAFAPLLYRIAYTALD